MIRISPLKMTIAQEMKNLRQAMRRFDEKHGTKHTFKEKHKGLIRSAIQRKKNRNEKEIQTGMH